MTMKQVLLDLIADKHTEAEEGFHTYLQAKMQKVAGIKEASQATVSKYKLKLPDGFKNDAIGKDMIWQWAENQEILTIEDVYIEGNEVHVIPLESRDAPQSPKMHSKLQDSLDNAAEEFAEARDMD